MTFLNMMDELKYQQTKFQVNQKLQTLISNEGYILFEPSFFEDYEAFVLKNKRVKKERMIKMFDHDGKILVLRPDITTSLMRQIIPKWQDRSVLRIFYNSTIFSRTAMGQIDTIRQFGVELLGDGKKTADLEVLNLISKVLNLFNLDYVIEVSDTRFLEGVMSALELNDQEQSKFKDILYRKSTYDLNKFIETKNLSKDTTMLLESLFSLQGELSMIEDKLKSFALNEQSKLAFNALKERINTLDDKKRYMVDLSLVSTYDYYDGILFKGYLKGSQKDVLSGGRYDPLTENYGKKIPAIGFTLNTQEVIKEVLVYE
ncbi:MAG: hypothetical protein CVV61_00650 [Tenericutes bacterium HGW-Tenericutes-6]|nr:MAG: hypothetical protein CVV61_00650 [Tenericutes bacterium HGW-Tenericutes-6]